jgi:hypothetical protein
VGSWVGVVGSLLVVVIVGGVLALVTRTVLADDQPATAEAPTGSGPASRSTDGDESGVADRPAADPPSADVHATDVSAPSGYRADAYRVGFVRRMGALAGLALAVGVLGAFTAVVVLAGGAALAGALQATL